NFVIDAGNQIWLQNLNLSESDAFVSLRNLAEALPLSQIRLAGEGSVLGSSQRLVYSTFSHRLTYVSHQESKEVDAHVLHVVTQDPVSKVKVVSRFSIFLGVPVLRCTTTVENEGHTG